VVALAEKYRPSEVEGTARALWSARGFPRPDGVVGHSSAPILRQFEGSLITGDDPGLIAFRAVAADIDARYFALADRRAMGTLRHVIGSTDDPAIALLQALSVWTGGTSGLPVDLTDRRAAVETILGRMATRGVVATRDTSLRVCPSCAQARSPERIIYQQEEGDTYLVRFPLPHPEGPVNALVWVDAPWRLLGASAVLVNPTLPYVVARYRRRGLDERILTSRASLARLLEWLPGGEVEVLEEAPGVHWQGQVYQYPLRHEFPMGGDLTPPSGTVLAVPDVGDSGTGIVPLVPGHGGTDALIADRLGILGWPLVTTRGQLDFNLAHKYSGLDIPTASEFVARDLGESGALFARLRVRRGVPHCALCGTPLVWAPGRAWCLEPSRLPAERRDLYRRLLPNDPPVGEVEVAAWPVSEPTAAPPGPLTVTLLECPSCERLEPLGASLQCVCGSRRNPVGRRLLPSIAGTLGAWARFDPFPAGDAAWLYLNERRRTPALVHHLAVMSGVIGVPNDVGLTLLPGVPEGGVQELVKSTGADAVRAALAGGEKRERSGPTFPDRCRQEARRLERWWYLVRETVGRCDPSLLASFAQPIAGSLAELDAEDRSILARWERIRLSALADYDHQAAGTAYRRVATFLSNDLEAYFGRVRSRLELPGTPPARRAALRTLHHLLRETAVVLAPVVPHIAEVVWGSLVPGRTSLFESTLDPLDSALLDEEAIKAWDRWGAVGRALTAFRRGAGVAPTVPIPSVIAIVGTEELAVQLRADRATLQRLGHVGRFEVFGPATPWTGRERSLEPVVPEIQRLYPQEAGQILHLIKRMPARKRTEGAPPEELSVVVRGQSRKIFPSMVEFVERLPDRMIAVPWKTGEMYVELPAHQPVPIRTPPPGSADAFRLLSRVERELRRTAPVPASDRGPVIIATLDPFASELRAVARPLAAYLGVSEVRLVDLSVEFPRAHCLFGRTRMGVHWWVRLPGEVFPSTHTKRRIVREHSARVRTIRPSTRLVELDYASPETVAHSEQVRALVQELDGILGTPLLGPTAVEGAWSAGFHSLEAFSQAPFDTISQLPGFGRPLAEVLVRKLGGVVPPRPVRTRSVDDSRSLEAAVAEPLGSLAIDTAPPAPYSSSRDLKEPPPPPSATLRPGRSEPVPAWRRGFSSASPPPSQDPLVPPPPTVAPAAAEVRPPTLTAEAPHSMDVIAGEELSAPPTDAPATDLPPTSDRVEREATGEALITAPSTPDTVGPPTSNAASSLPIIAEKLPEGGPQDDRETGANVITEALDDPPLPRPISEPPAESGPANPSSRELDAPAPEATANEIPAFTAPSGVGEGISARDSSSIPLPPGTLPIEPPPRASATDPGGTEGPAPGPHTPPNIPEMDPPWGGELEEPWTPKSSDSADERELPANFSAPTVPESLAGGTPIPHTVASEPRATVVEVPSSIEEPGIGNLGPITPEPLNSEDSHDPGSLPVPATEGTTSPEGSNRDPVPALEAEPSTLAPSIESGVALVLPTPGVDSTRPEAPEDPKLSSPTGPEAPDVSGERSIVDGARIESPDIQTSETVEVNSGTATPVAEELVESAQRGTVPVFSTPEVSGVAGSESRPMESSEVEQEPFHSPHPPVVTVGEPPENAALSPVRIEPQTSEPPDHLSAPPSPVPPNESSPSVNEPPSSPSETVTVAPEELADPSAPRLDPESPLAPTVMLAPSQSPAGPELSPPEAPTLAPVLPIPPPTPTGGILLNVAPSYLPAFAHFLDATAAGHRGICVVRESPDRLRAHVGPRPVEIYWLSNLGRGLTLRPSDLEGYGAFLIKSVDQDRVTAVFLEGVEYLARVHGAERVIEQLAAFNVVAQAHQARVWVFLHPDLIPPADLALFSAAFGSAPPLD
jgi:hypothetical protein